MEAAGIDIANAFGLPSTMKKLLVLGSIGRKAIRWESEHALILAPRGLILEPHTACGQVWHVADRGFFTPSSGP